MSNPTINREVKTSHLLALMTIGVFVILFVSKSALAGKSAALPVTATVIANARMNTLYQATVLTISSADIDRGYIDVPAGSRFFVNTNSRSGYIMEFHRLVNIFESVDISGLLGSATSLGSDGGAIVQRGFSTADQKCELSFHFSLRHNIAPGTYPWPMQMTLRAL